MTREELVNGMGFFGEELEEMEKKLKAAVKEEFVGLSKFNSDKTARHLAMMFVASVARGFAGIEKVESNVIAELISYLDSFISREERRIANLINEG